MKYQDDDALDRALFRLDLEEPPADLRASILAATAYAPKPLFSSYDIAAIATLLAVALVLIDLIVGNGGAAFEQTLRSIDIFAMRGLSSASTLAWIAVGGATAIWLSLFTGFQSIPLPHRKGVSTPKR